MGHHDRGLGKPVPVSVGVVNFKRLPDHAHMVMISHFELIPTVISTLSLLCKRYQLFVSSILSPGV